METCKVLDFKKESQDGSF